MGFTILGLRWIFPRMFPTRFVGNNLWEIPPKKGYGHMFQNVFKELFVDLYFKKKLLIAIP